MTEEHDDPAPLPRPHETTGRISPNISIHHRGRRAAAATVWAGVAVATTVIVAAVVVCAGDHQPEPPRAPSAHLHTHPAPGQQFQPSCGRFVTARGTAHRSRAGLIRARVGGMRQRIVITSPVTDSSTT